MNYPSPNPLHRRADLAVHVLGLTIILFGGGVLIFKAVGNLDISLIAAAIIYVACALASSLASSAYHFSRSHSKRQLLRRMDHAAIYLSITGTFTPFFVQANTLLTNSLLWICWGLTASAIWCKVTQHNVKSKWSTASYLGLGAIGLCALPDLGHTPHAALWCIVAGAVCYVFGTTFYVQKSIAYRFAVWHSWVNFGGILMFAGIWIALFQ